MSIGAVTGTGTLGGNGTYTIGENNSNITVSFSSASPIVKTGEGTMIVETAGKLTKAVTVKAGVLRFDVGETAALFGGVLTVEGTGSAVGSGLLTSLTMKSGAVLTPRSLLMEDVFGGVVPGKVKSSAAVNFNEGSTLNIIIQGTDSHSSLEPKFLTMNGVVKVAFTDDYKPKAGDEFILWEASSFSGTPTFDLPDLPEGLYWVASDMAAKKGVLRITDDSTQGVGRLAADTPVVCEVFTLSGVRLAVFNAVKADAADQVLREGLAAGTYIVKMNGGKRIETMKVMVR